MSFLRKGARRRGRVATALTTVGALAAFQALAIVGAGAALAVTGMHVQPRPPARSTSRSTRATRRAVAVEARAATSTRRRRPARSCSTAAGSTSRCVQHAVRERHELEHHVDRGPRLAGRQRDLRTSTTAGGTAARPFNSAIALVDRHGLDLGTAASTSSTSTGPTTAATTTWSRDRRRSPERCRRRAAGRRGLSSCAASTATTCIDGSAGCQPRSRSSHGGDGDDWIALGAQDRAHRSPSTSVTRSAEARRRHAQLRDPDDQRRHRRSGRPGWAQRQRGLRRRSTRATSTTSIGGFENYETGSGNDCLVGRWCRPRRGSRVTATTTSTATVGDDTIDWSSSSAAMTIDPERSDRDRPGLRHVRGRDRQLRRLGLRRHADLGRPARSTHVRGRGRGRHGRRAASDAGPVIDLDDAGRLPAPARGPRDSTLENAIGGSGNDNLIGNDLRNQLTGNDGDDYLDGAGRERHAARWAGQRHLLRWHRGRHGSASRTPRRR